MDTLHHAWHHLSISLISWWNNSPCSSLTTPRFLGTGLNVRRGNVVSGSFYILKLYISLAYCLQLAHNLSLLFPKNLTLTSIKESKLLFQQESIDSSNILSLVSALICGPTKMPSLTFASERAGNMLLR